MKQLATSICAWIALLAMGLAQDGAENPQGKNVAGAEKTANAKDAPGKGEGNKKWPEEQLYIQLTKGPSRVKGVEKVLEAPDRFSPLILFTSAQVALNANRLEDSGFLFYTGQVRAQFDRECFPPKGTGGDNPFVMISALSQQIGATVNLKVMDNPKVFSKVFERLKDWSPKAPDDYDPGYEYTERKTEEQALKATEQDRKEFASRMADLVTLVSDPDYLAATRLLRKYNLGFGKNRPTKQEYDKAFETMQRIEKEKGIEGFAKQITDNEESLEDVKDEFEQQIEEVKDENNKAD